MQKTYTCKYCNKSYHSNEARNGHQVHCKMNPKSKAMQQKIQKTIRERGSLRRNSTRRQYLKNCQKCGKEYRVYITEWANLNKRYSKFCSISCSNFRIHSKQTKNKISNSLITFNAKQICSNCIICGKVMKFNKIGQVRKTCSKQCLHIAKSNAAHLGLKSGGGWKSRSLISYPEKFFMEVLGSNGIQYIHNYKVLQRELDETLNSFYFLDFYLPKYNIDLQIDGKQHQDLESKEHDKFRDEILSKTYKIHRIKWNEINTQQGKSLMKIKISKFLEICY